jgi:hypothetical protein
VSGTFGMVFRPPDVCAAQSRQSHRRVEDADFQTARVVSPRAGMVRLSASAKGRVSGTDGSDAKVRRSYAESSGSAAAYNPFRIQYKYKPTESFPHSSTAIHSFRKHFDLS